MDITEVKVSMKQILGHIYPVGSIYLSVNSTNPSLFFGGNWVPWGEGRVPVGIGTATDESGKELTFDSADAIGGEYTHKIIVDELPAHNHKIYSEYSPTYGVGLASNVGMNNDVSCGGTVTGDGAKYQIRSSHCGGGTPHNNIQPYITCYMWKRIG